MVTIPVPIETFFYPNLRETNKEIFVSLPYGLIKAR